MNNNFREEIKFSIPIKCDEEGFTGHECPNKDCLGYFKIQFGTGLKGSPPCICPYCGHTDPHDQFFTKEQIEYAKSVALHQITGDILQDLKKFEKKPNSRALVSIGIEVKGRPHPIHYYREKQLEQEVICDNCTLRYAIYGVFGFCPDCGIHNSLQILKMNMDIVDKMIKLAESHENQVKEKLLENALEDAVSTMDGFGREICKLNSKKSTNKSKAENISFQNIKNARKNMIELFNIDIKNPISDSEWEMICKSFQKRHLMAHKLGIIDEKYIQETGENRSLIGRKIDVKTEEILEFTIGLKDIGDYLFKELEKL